MRSAPGWPSPLATGRRIVETRQGPDAGNAVTITGEPIEPTW